MTFDDYDYDDPGAPVSRPVALWWWLKSWCWWAVYEIRPYDMIADRRRWFWQPRERCQWSQKGLR